MTRPGRRGRLGGFALTLAVLTATLTPLAACGRGDGKTAGPEETPSARTYRVRGILQSLPDPATGTGQLRVRHEAIPDLVGASGEVEGMAAMTMPFPVAEEVDLAGLTPGDPVVFTLRVDWDSSRPVAVTGIERLPPGTELELD